ncbi:MAG: thioredoxin domain-containing protein [Balneolaceae bacterium]|nr:thioredoxin domain-containing protein [Balneolaceae bacterium]
MFLLRYWNRTNNNEALNMVEQTLTNMRHGGLFDQIGYGFHRYSTDQKWLVPHFEKMLYDQAMLIMAYTEAWQATNNNLFRQTAQEIIEYVLRDLQDSDGAFYSAEDADSEGEEGKFYLWSISEIRDLLPAADAELAIEVFNMTEEGNYEDEATRQRTGKNILHLSKPIVDLAEERNLSKEQLSLKLQNIRTTLLEAREHRVRPLLDDKILTDWNGLMIAALAKAGRAFDESSYINEAKRSLSFINKTLLSEKQLLHRYRDDEAAIHAHADDYSFLIWGLYELYESTFETEFLKQALNLQEDFIANFWDEETGGFFFTAHKSEKLLGRTKEVYDGALPSGNSIAMLNLLRLGRITGNTDWEQKADSMNKLFSSQVSQAPTGFGQLLQALDFELGISYEVTIAGKKAASDTQKMLKTLYHSFSPNKVVVLNDPDDSEINKLAPYTKNQAMKNGKATAYVCENYSCKAPTNDPKIMLKELTSPSN